MGGVGSGRKPEPKLPINSVAQDMFIPNNSGTANFVQTAGDTVFVDGGMIFGGMYFHSETPYTVATIDEGVGVQVKGFNTASASNNVGVDITESHLLIKKAGVYLCSLSLSISAAQKNEYEIEVMTNDGTGEVENSHIHRTTSVANAVGQASTSFLATFAVDDTLEVWVKRIDGGAPDKDIDFVAITFNIVQIGG